MRQYVGVCRPGQRGREAARIDGARDLALLRRILFPLFFRGVATVATFAFLNAWNEFLAALVLLSSNKTRSPPR